MPEPMILICGTGRSGTSAVARLLHEAGISVGHDLIPADEHNAEGYFEERRLVMVNEAILAAAGLHEWFATASRAELLTVAHTFAAEMMELAERATPAWKDPRFCWTLEAWLEVLPERPRVIVCLRSPGEVVASTMRYYGLEGDEARRAAEHVWRAQGERLLEVIESYGLDVLAVEYASLIADPQSAVGPIARFAGRRLDPAFIRQDLRHHREETAPELIPLYNRLAALGERWRATPGGARSA
jgi:hypothetical protein